METVFQLLRRVMGGDNSALPILADALEDAGFQRLIDRRDLGPEAYLEHFRSPGGCLARSHGCSWAEYLYNKLEHLEVR